MYKEEKKRKEKGKPGTKRMWIRGKIGEKLERDV